MWGAEENVGTSRWSLPWRVGQGPWAPDVAPPEAGPGCQGGQNSQKALVTSGVAGRFPCKSKVARYTVFPWKAGVDGPWRGAEEWQQVFAEPLLGARVGAGPSPQQLVLQGQELALGLHSCKCGAWI